MSKLCRILALPLALGALPPAGAEDAAMTEAQKYSYSIGVDLARSLGPVRESIDIEALKQGLDDQYGKGISLLSDEERQAVKRAVAERMQLDVDSRAERARREGEAFLLENAKKPGVRTTASGLQYEVLREGAGAARPTVDSRVTVHYTGSLLSGEIFDSSYSRETAVTFPLASVIAGWTEGVQLMSRGAKYRFYIPAPLAYAERGAGTKIGANQVLIFEVELVSFENPKGTQLRKRGK